MVRYAIIGLGNPGREYENTRHNAGFNAIDVLAEKTGARYWKNTCGCQLAVTTHGSDEIVLAKPQSFMNASGGPVKAVLAEYGVGLEHLIVIHDEMDLEPGSVRIKRGGGHAGHNGLKSIHAKLQTPDYLRVRVGIGKPPGRRPGADYVLDQLKGDGLEDFKADCACAAEAVLSIIDDGPDAAMNHFNAV